MTFNFTVVAPPTTDAAPPPLPPAGTPAPRAAKATTQQLRNPTLTTFALDDRGKLIVLIPKHRNTLKPTDLARVQNFQKTQPRDWIRLRLEWLWVLDLARQGKVLIDADAKAAVNTALDASVLVPLHPLAKEQSIAWLADKPVLKAKRSDFNLGIVAGKEYPAEIESVVIKDRRIDHTVKSTTGVVKARATIRKSKRLQITVRGAAPKPYIWLEGHDKPDALFDLFEVDDVQALPLVDPKRLARARAAVVAVNEEHKHRWPVRGGGVRGLTDWQIDDASLAVAEGRALLAWEMGLGKTAPGGMVFASALAKMGAPDLALFIVPQDLIPQWIREARKLFGRVVQRVDSAGAVMEAIRDRREGRTLQPLPITARELRDLIRQKKAKGWYIIHYEAVSRSGRREIIDDQTKDRLLWAKSGYSSLTTAFKQATIVLDEVTRAQGQETFISQAIRGIRAKYRLGLTGTPVRNYLVNIFWLLWWCIGNRSIRFPYSYAEGQKAFLRDFGTQEKVEGETTIRQVPEPGNLLLLRRILAPSVIRRRVDEIGLPVNCRYITVPTPWGLRQKEQYANWLDPEKFEEYWRRKFPFTNLKPGEIRKLGAALGQFSHLEYATTCPESESEDFGDPSLGKSNWTPKLARALDIIRKHVKNGERVLFGSSLVPTVPWVAERLREVGHKVECLTERDKNGKHVSLGPGARAEAVLRFVASGGQVLCASMNAMALGHNLDMVSTVVVAGLPWDLATFEQFLARVRRFSSKRDISVYVLLTEGSLDEKKWDLLQRKRAGAARALDIVDFARDESHVSLEEVLAELVARGVTDGPVVDELSLQRVWEEHAKGGSVVLSTDSIEMESSRRGRRATFYQMTLGAPEPRPEPSAAWRAIYELSGALSAGYRVPFNSGHQAGIDPRTKLFVLVDRSLRVLATGPAYEVAACAGKNFTPREITLACRLARMGPVDRNLALGWWKQGSWQTELVPEDAVWWQKGSWQAELELEAA